MLNLFVDPRTLQIHRVSSHFSGSYLLKLQKSINQRDDTCLNTTFDTKNQNCLIDRVFFATNACWKRDKCLPKHHVRFAFHSHIEPALHVALHVIILWLLVLVGWVVAIHQSSRGFVGQWLRCPSSGKSGVSEQKKMGSIVITGKPHCQAISSIGTSVIAKGKRHTSGKHAREGVINCTIWRILNKIPMNMCSRASGWEVIHTLVT